ncbi:uncharacterized protein APUU_30733S [Aspergillus puulaauensis]|uniref:Uncharacterized protein n=1 Tax=Aspergillus puulaauensis TaxID=1220207 RepID=A0A7R8AMC6_9EURO|nr:uncharacterized protein APUU_30733S [Aspergillus puulaauensis]BCS22508.1 hypothetical protein APUU_30733S [Aspergillus puulaauensis]
MRFCLKTTKVGLSIHQPFRHRTFVLANSNDTGNRPNISSTSRPRIPHIFAIIQLLLRIGTLGTAIAALCILGKLSVKYKTAKNNRGKTFGGAISMSALALPINTWEIIALAIPNPTKKIKRAATCVVGFADFIVFAVGLYAVFEVALSDYGLGNAPVGYETPWKGLQNLAVILVAVVVAETFLALILGCVGCCREARVAKREKRAGERL